MIPDPTEPAGTAATAQPRILVINHSPEVLALIRVLLEEDHFRVTTQSHLDHDLDAISTRSPR